MQELVQRIENSPPTTVKWPVPTADPPTDDFRGGRRRRSGAAGSFRPAPFNRRHRVSTRASPAPRSVRVLTTVALTVVVGLFALVPTLVTTTLSASASTNGSTGDTGLWLVGSDGGIFNYGSAGFYGSTGGVHLNKPVVAMAATPDGRGYWLAASDGGIFAYGDAGLLWLHRRMPLNKPVVAMAATPDGRGYWLAASDGGIFSYGDAHFYGSTGGTRLNRPVVAMAGTPDGHGYWLVASDGGIFAYGDANFYGSTGGLALNKPIVAMATTPDGHGYWLVASDGGIFSYGDAADYGSTSGMATGSPVVAMAATPDGLGYWLITSGGGIYPFGDAASYGSPGGLALNKPVVGAAAAAVPVVSAVQPSSAAPPTNGPSAPPTTTTTTTTTTTEPPTTTTTTEPPTTTTTTTTTPTPPATDPSGSMAAPTGYSASQLIFDDQFIGTSLDTSKWNTYSGSRGAALEQRGQPARPYSGPNTPITNEGAMFGPSQVSVDNGLTLTAQRNTNAYAATYPWLSGVITTGSKFTLPNAGWYVQVRAKMPDQSQGMWPAIWFLCGVSCPNDNEFDGFEGGWLASSPDDVMHSDYFADAGQQQQAYDVGSDVSSGYHTYGFQLLPNKSVTVFFDGKQVWQVNASSTLTITGEPYEIIIEAPGGHRRDVGLAHPDHCLDAQLEYAHRRSAGLFRLVAQRASSSSTEPAASVDTPTGACRPLGSRA